MNNGINFLDRLQEVFPRKKMYFEIFEIMSTEGAVDNESILTTIFTNCKNGKSF